ncbi:TniQ family protein [Shewanella algae]|uniref:TniQ family protein n=1 Tax=Shewanella algae TaxID=38313 RepID=UPI001AAD824C|nr:TniQ family protein [Shewanella algae]MBO2622590.1 TniQ family protein [Shewanella algae]MDV2963934.1 TniQ family protein [Shewanella algae]
MAFLFAPRARAFNDESLESYLLRVVAENFFDTYEQLSLAIREELQELDYEAHGAFPVELKRLNVYHAKHNSHFRMRALRLIETLLGLPHNELHKLALLRSSRLFLGSMVAVHRNGIDIPLSFIRYSADHGAEIVPVCPQCLAEHAYIRQTWHLKPVIACAKHKCELLHHCPECHSKINYLDNESITHCPCGFEFATAASIKAKNEAVFVARNLFADESSPKHDAIFASASATHRLAALAWYQKSHNKDMRAVVMEVGGYFGNWPKQFYDWLDEITKGAEYKLIDLFNRTEFRTIYGDLIIQSQCLRPEDKEPHFIYLALVEYLCRLVSMHPKSKKANVADMLISVREAAVLLSTTHEQVYRLYQDGILTSGLRQKLHQRIDPHVGVFYLRQVIEYKQSFGDSRQREYASAW